MFSIVWSIGNGTAAGVTNLADIYVRAEFESTVIDHAEARVRQQTLETALLEAILDNTQKRAVSGTISRIPRVWLQTHNPYGPPQELGAGTFVIMRSVRPDARKAFNEPVKEPELDGEPPMKYSQLHWGTVGVRIRS